jgi:hypothetical protein
LIVQKGIYKVMLYNFTINLMQITSITIDR